jgi:hypothetical protein
MFERLIDMRISSIAATVALLVTPLALHAADPAKTKKDVSKAPAPAAQGLTAEQQKADVERGVKILTLFHGALQNKEIPEDQKGYLFSCLYKNKLEQISIATGDVLEKNPKLDGNDPKILYQVAATICGVTKAPSFANAQKSAAPSGSAPQGR